MTAPTPRTDAETATGAPIYRELCEQFERELAYMRTRNAEQATGQFGREARAHADETMAERAKMQKAFEEGR